MNPTWADLFSDPKKLSDASQFGPSTTRRFVSGGVIKEMGVKTDDAGVLFIGSPNVEVTFPPFPSTLKCFVHLRQDCHFAVEDPLLFPQPLQPESAAHLAMIPTPEYPFASENFQILFMAPDTWEMFTIIDQISHLGILEDDLGFIALCQDLTKEIERADRLYSETHRMGTKLPSSDKFV